MNKDKLITANSISNKIIELTNHRQNVDRVIHERNEICLSLIGNYSNDHVKLKEELMPVKSEHLIDAYKASIDAEIAKLEIKFSML